MNFLKVQCTICDIIEELDNESLEAKRLRNRYSHLYLCDVCYERIKINTLKRHETGKFKLFHTEEDDTK